MATYRLEFASTAVRQLGSLPLKIQRRVSTKIEALATEPRPAGCRKLKGPDDIFRVRVGDYRVLYQVGDDVLLVLVVSVRKRKEAYKK
ncbi:MAG: type II toxin-antitoxin system RelE/ParE family toxin [bacterium]|nr:type II toxin-antitoxin system RelE/ParE family toxin [bacterium]MDT8365520.1 type II toxin-antitoxin system RelE/ParE family toxin [bacterium]